MKAVVTGLGRSGTHWLATWWGIPHEPLGISNEEAKALATCSSEEFQAMVGRLPEASVDSHMRFCVSRLRRHGVYVIWLWRREDEWVQSMQRIQPDVPIDTHRLQYQAAFGYSVEANGLLKLENLAPFGPPPTNVS